MISDTTVSLPVKRLVESFDSKISSDCPLLVCAATCFRGRWDRAGGPAASSFVNATLHSAEHLPREM